MESTNTFYPVFEPDQVLTSDHLNQLRKFLAVQDRLSRQLLHGIGIVCGLQVSNPALHTIRISKGVGITSKGFLVTLNESDCTHYRLYNDKVYNEVNCDDQIEGKYDLFLDDDNVQYNLWELFTTNEEIESTDENIKLLSEPPSEGADPLDLSQMCVLLYLEIEDLDMLACFGEDCDEKGIQRHFNVRKLLIHKDDLIEVIKEAHEYDELSESTLEEEINAKYKLKPINLKRLGYGFSSIAQTLSLKDYHNFDTLFNNYTLVIQDGVSDVSNALYDTYDAYELLLKDLYPTNPFKDFNSININQNPLYIKIRSAVLANRLVIQYIYDFLFDLMCAYDEFRESAFNLAVLCCPNPKWFPRHLMLGMATQPEEEPSHYRHYFIYSPILGKQQDLLEKVKQYHKRIVSMLEEFNEQVLNYQDIKVTPGSPYALPISNRAIPFYYNVTAEGQLIKLWNFDKTARLRSNTLLSYHGSSYNLEDEFVSQPMLWDNKKYDFLRIEGHIGKNYESALSNLLTQKERLNLPIKIVGVKLSKRFANTNVDVECHFDDLQTLFRTFTTELKCMLYEEAEFFRNLDTDLDEGKGTGGVIDLKRGVQESEGKKGDKESGEKKVRTSEKILNLLSSDAPKAAESEGRATKNLRTNMNVGGTPDFNFGGDDIVYELNYGFDYSPSTEGSVGYLMDMISSGSGQNPFTAIFNYYASGQLGIYNPGFFIYTVLYPIQIATNIDTLLNNVPEKLEDLKLETLQKDYNALVESASGFKNSIQENLNDPEYQRMGNEEVLLYRLDKLIYHCSIKKIVALYNLYLKRIETVQKKNLFSQFAKEHPGMEHMAGVPKGGTLVLVYIDTNDMSAKEQGNDLKASLASGYDYQVSKDENENLHVWEDEIQPAAEKKPGIRSVASGRKVSGGTRNIRTNVESFSSGYGIGDDKFLNYLQQNQGIVPNEIINRYIESLGLMQFTDDDLPPNNIVVADFALPYLCCGSCSEIATMVVSQIVFRLDGTEFCKNDTSLHYFTIEPTGGTISGPGIVTSDGISAFQPSSINNDEWKENLTLTYLVNNHTVVFNIKVYNPIAGFTASDADPIEGTDRMRVSFTNECQNDESATYIFDFGDDGENYEGLNFPTDHEYNISESDQTFTISLKIVKGVCTSSEVFQTVTIPGEEATFAIDREFVCNNIEDIKVYFITVPYPDAANLIVSEQGLNILEDGDGYYFQPYNLTPGTYSFNYRNIEESIQIAAAVEFQLYLIPNPDNPLQFTISYMGETYQSIKWFVRYNGDDTWTEVGINVDNIELNFEEEQLPADVRAIVENVFGCLSEELVNIAAPEVEFSIGSNNVCNNIRSQKVYFVTNPVPEDGSEITSNPAVNIKKDNGGFYFKPFGLTSGTYTFTYKGISVTCKINDPISFQLTATLNPDKELEYTISYVGDNYKNIGWSVLVNGGDKFIELNDDDDKPEIVLNFTKDQLPAIVRAVVTSLDGCISSNTVEIKIVETTTCYNIDIFKCWNDTVIKFTDVYPVVRALEDRGKPVNQDDQNENIDLLLEILRDSDNCGFNEEIDILNPEGCLNLGGIESRFHLLNCMVTNGVQIKGFDPTKIDDYREKPSVLNDYILEYQKENCCQQQGRTFNVETKLLDAFPAKDKIKILKNRGSTNYEGKSDSALTKMILRSKGGSDISEGEFNLIGVKTIRGVLKENGTPFPARAKKADLIKLLF